MQNSIWKDKFDVIIISILFVIVFLTWVFTGYNPQVRDIVIAFTSAVTVALGLRVRSLNTPDAGGVQATATLTMEPAPAEPGDQQKEGQKNADN